MLTADPKSAVLLKKMCPCKCSYWTSDKFRSKIWPLSSITLLLVSTVGTGDFPPLPADALPAGWHSDGSERWQQHSGETGQEQTASPDLRERRETGPGAQGRQIRGVLGAHAGKRRRKTSMKTNRNCVFNHMSRSLLELKMALSSTYLLLFCGLFMEFQAKMLTFIQSQK